MAHITRSRYVGSCSRAIAEASLGAEGRFATAAAKREISAELLRRSGRFDIGAGSRGLRAGANVALCYHRRARETRPSYIKYNNFARKQGDRDVSDARGKIGSLKGEKITDFCFQPFFNFSYLSHSYFHRYLGDYKNNRGGIRELNFRETNTYIPRLIPVKFALMKF